VSNPKRIAVASKGGSLAERWTRSRPLIIVLGHRETCDRSCVASHRVDPSEPSASRRLPPPPPDRRSSGPPRPAHRPGLVARKTRRSFRGRFSDALSVLCGSSRSARCPALPREDEGDSRGREGTREARQSRDSPRQQDRASWIADRGSREPTRTPRDPRGASSSSSSSLLSSSSSSSSSSLPPPQSSLSRSGCSRFRTASCDFLPLVEGTCRWVRV